MIETTLLLVPIIALLMVLALIGWIIYLAIRSFGAAEDDRARAVRTRARLILTVVLLFIAGGVLSLMLFLKSFDVPPFAATGAVEELLAPQIDALLHRADRRDNDVDSTVALFEQEALASLLAHPVFLGAWLEESNGSRRLLALKHYDYNYRWSYTPTEPSIGSPVVNRYRDTLSDGSVRSVIEYQRRLINRHGEEVEIILVLDLEELERLETTPSRGEPSPLFGVPTNISY